MFFAGLNLYNKVERIDNTSRGRIVGPARFMANRTTNGPQNQESAAQRPQNQNSPAQHQGSSALNSTYPVQM